VDKLGEADWLNDNEPTEFRPLRAIYAVRCPEKNQEFVPRHGKKKRK